jgi:hypothetical protein
MGAAAGSWAPIKVYTITESVKSGSVNPNTDHDPACILMALSRNALEAAQTCQPDV